MSHCNSTESESMKSFVNCFYSVKIQFFNELYLLCNANNCDYNTVKELMLKNNSNISIPGFSYEIFIVSFDRNDNISHSSKYQFNNDPILANDYHQVKVYSMDYHRDYKKYSAVVKITNDKFIRSYLARQGNLSCSELLMY